jgi:hypothetical protein
MWGDTAEIDFANSAPHFHRCHHFHHVSECTAPIVLGATLQRACCGRERLARRRQCPNVGKAVEHTGVQLLNIFHHHIAASQPHPFLLKIVPVPQPPPARPPPLLQPWVSFPNW